MDGEEYFSKRNNVSKNMEVKNKGHIQGTVIICLAEL